MNKQNIILLFLVITIILQVVSLSITCKNKNCKKCSTNSKTCSQCNDNYELINNKCIIKANEKNMSYTFMRQMRMLASSKSCYVRNCWTCEFFYKTRCSSCYTGYQNLITYCKPLYCIDKMCQTCPIDIDKCVACKDPNWAIDFFGKCVDKCDITTCKTCDTSVSSGLKKCTECQSGYDLDCKYLSYIYIYIYIVN